MQINHSLHRSNFDRYGTYIGHSFAFKNFDVVKTRLNLSKQQVKYSVISFIDTRVRYCKGTIEVTFFGNATGTINLNLSDSLFSLNKKVFVILRNVHVHHLLSSRIVVGV